MERDAAIDLLRRLLDAQGAFYAGGPAEPLRELLDADVEWHIPGHNAIAGDYHGVDDVMDYFAHRREIAEGSVELEQGEVLVGDADHAAALTAASVDRDGDEVRWSTVGLYRIADGRIAACWLLPLDMVAFDRIWA